MQQADAGEDEEPVIWGPVSAEIPSRDQRLIRKDTVEESLPQILRRGRFTAGHDDTVVGEIKEKVVPDPERVPPAEVMDPLLPDDASREDVVAMIEEQVEKNGGLITGMVTVTPKIARVYPRLESIVGSALPFAGGTIYLDDRVGEQTEYEIFEGELDGYSISGVSFGSKPIQYCDATGCQILQDVSDADWHTVTLAPSTESKDSKVAGDAVTMNPAATFLPIQQATDPENDDEEKDGVPALDAMDILGLMAMGDPFLMETDGVYYEMHPEREEEAEGVHGSYTVDVRPARVLKQDGQLIQQPPELERRKDAILEDNPDMSESTAYAIAQDQLNDEQESQASYTTSTPGLRNPTYGDDDEEDEDEEEAEVRQANGDDVDGDVDPVETVDDMVAHLVEDDGFRPDLEDESEREQAARTVALRLASEMMRQAQVPENAVSIRHKSEAPEGAQTVTGPRGGLYYVPGTGEDKDGSDNGSGGRTQEWREEFQDRDFDRLRDEPFEFLDRESPRVDAGEARNTLLAWNDWPTEAPEMWVYAADKTGNTNVHPDVDTSEGQSKLTPDVEEDLEEYASTTQSIVRETDPTYDPDTDTVRVYRGIGGEVVQDLREEFEGRPSGAKIQEEVRHRSLSSWSSDPRVADMFATQAEQEGVVLEQRVKVDNIIGTSYTGPPGRHEGEVEYIVAHEDEEADANVLLNGSSALQEAAREQAKAWRSALEEATS